MNLLQEQSQESINPYFLPPQYLTWWFVLKYKYSYYFSTWLLVFALFRLIGLACFHQKYFIISPLIIVITFHVVLRKAVILHL